MKQKLFEQQTAILEDMQTKGYNVVECGNCSGMILVSKANKLNDECVLCPHCLEQMSLSDCPDLYYNGMWIPPINEN